MVGNLLLLAFTLFCYLLTVDDKSSMNDFANDASLVSI